MIGDKIKSLREQQGLSIKDLSEKSGICLVSLYAYEGNKHKPNALTLYKLARALGCNYDDLVE